MAEQVFLNDKLIDADNASVYANDGGFLYGAGLFETMQAHNGVVFRLDDHLERLLASAKWLSIEHGYDKEYLADAVSQVLKANELADARIRLTVTAGSITQADEYRKGTLLAAAGKFQPYPSEYYSKGVLVTLCLYRQNITDPACGHKTTSYFPRMLALKQAHQKKAAEALWFTTDGRLAEGCISNVFLVKNSVLHTPALNTPVLPGIARKTVCELARTNGIELIEKDLTIDDLLGADEVFLTNVIMQVIPVVGIEKHSVGQGRPGTITGKLRELYAQFFHDTCKVRQ